MSEKVSHPEHYNKPGHKECIEEMLEKYGPGPVFWFCKLNAYKYRYRAGGKPGEAAEDDIKKAEWYEDYAADLAARSR